jgi:prepilin peptidase CpaA
MTSTSAWVCVIVVLAAAAADVASRKIPNIMTLGGLFVGLTLQVANGAVDGGLGEAIRGLAFGLGGAIVCAIIPVISWRRGELGGGDVKLFAAIGALIGPAAGFDVQAATFLISLLVLFPYRLVRHGALRRVVANARIGVVNRLRMGKTPLAYIEGPALPPVILAPSIGAAVVITLVGRGAFV